MVQVLQHLLQYQPPSSHIPLVRRKHLHQRSYFIIMNEQLITMPIYKANLDVQIKQDQKDGLGLIDHESIDSFPTWRFRGSSEKSIYKDNANYCETSGPHKNALIRFNKLKSEYEFAIQPSPQAFVVVKDIKSANGPEYPLEVGSIIRLGKIEYRVIEERDRNMQISQAPCFIKQVALQEAQTVFECRFCFMEGKQSKENLFLYDICRCQGNSKAVHLECLKYWVDQNLTKEETHFGLTLKWVKPYECSICKDALPVRVKFRNEYYDLFTLDRPELQYLILQGVNRDKNQGSEMYLVHGLLNDNIKIGRAFTCDIKAQDITVSRHHATIRLAENGNFVISDNKSKFGTLVSINNKRVLLDCVSCSLQQGRILIYLNQVDTIHRSSPSTQHKLTQLPQINKQFDEDEPQMDDDSFQIENK